MGGGGGGWGYLDRLDCCVDITSSTVILPALWYFSSALILLLAMYFYRTCLISF